MSNNSEKIEIQKGVILLDINNCSFDIDLSVNNTIDYADLIKKAKNILGLESSDGNIDTSNQDKKSAKKGSRKVILNDVIEKYSSAHFGGSKELIDDDDDDDEDDGLAGSIGDYDSDFVDDSEFVEDAEMKDLIQRTRTKQTGFFSSTGQVETITLKDTLSNQSQTSKKKSIEKNAQFEPYFPTKHQKMAEASNEKVGYLKCFNKLVLALRERKNEGAENFEQGKQQSPENLRKPIMDVYITFVKWVEKVNSTILSTKPRIDEVLASSNVIGKSRAINKLYKKIADMWPEEFNVTAEKIEQICLRKQPIDLINISFDYSKGKGEKAPKIKSAEKCKQQDKIGKLEPNIYSHSSFPSVVYRVEDFKISEH